MIRKWTLKRNLVVVNVILLTAALLYSSIMLIRYSGEAVSYTHLDVYKRQDQRSVWNLRRRYGGFHSYG